MTTKDSYYQALPNDDPLTGEVTNIEFDLKQSILEFKEAVQNLSDFCRKNKYSLDNNSYIQSRHLKSEIAQKKAAIVHQELMKFTLLKSKINKKQKEILNKKWSELFNKILKNYEAILKSEQIRDSNPILKDKKFDEKLDASMIIYPDENPVDVSISEKIKIEEKEALLNIEKEMSFVKSLFSKLGNEISTQDTQVNMLKDYVVHVENSVSDTTNEMRTYNETLIRKRKRKIYIFSIIFLIIFIYVIWRIFIMWTMPRILYKIG